MNMKLLKFLILRAKKLNKAILSKPDLQLTKGERIAHASSILKSNKWK